MRAKPFLLAALQDPDSEIAHRARGCLRQIDEGTTEAATSAAIRVLAKLHPDGASAALMNYLPSAGEETLAEQVRLSLAELAIRDGKADPALVKALSDPSPAKRGAAAFALGHAGRDGTLSARAVAVIQPIQQGSIHTNVQVHVKNCSAASVDNAFAFGG